MMRVLWVCNIMLPVVAEHLGLEASNKEGWLTGLSTAILRHQKENETELGVCFPAEESLAGFEQILQAPGTDGRIHAFGFYSQGGSVRGKNGETAERDHEEIPAGYDTLFRNGISSYAGGSESF